MYDKDNSISLYLITRISEVLSNEDMPQVQRTARCQVIIHEALKVAYENGAYDLDTYKAWLEVFLNHMANAPVLRNKHERVVSRGGNSITISGEVRNSPITQGNR